MNRKISRGAQARMNQYLHAEPEEKSFERKLQDKDFNTKFFYPTQPKKKLVVHPDMREGDPLVYEADAKEIEVWHKDMAEYVKDEQRLHEEFRKEMLLYWNVEESDLESNFVNALYGEAWNRGHSHGLSEVSACFGNLTDLYRAHKHDVKIAVEKEKKI